MARFPLRSLAIAFLLFATTAQAALVAPVIQDITETVSGITGGVLRAGVWTVDVPSGAYPGNASISVSVPAEAPLSCSLGISPNNKNLFARPVTITAKPLLVTKNMRIEWWDPNSKEWVPVPGSTVDLTQRTVSAKIWHFSEYRVGDGRNGW